MCVLSHLVVSDFATPWTVACQVPLFMGFSRPETGVNCYALLQGIFLTQGLNLCLFHPYHLESPVFSLKHTVNRGPGLAHLHRSCDLSLWLPRHLALSLQVYCSAPTRWGPKDLPLSTQTYWLRSFDYNILQTLEASDRPLWLSHKLAKPAACSGLLWESLFQRLTCLAGFSTMTVRALVDG